MRNSASKRFASAFLAFAMFIVPFSVGAQTRIPVSKNKYKVEDDVKLGQQAANEAERRFPLLNDSFVQNYVQRVGNRLVDAMPQEYDYPQFRYTFKVVNARDINAFALPGGPMYVNRGMIEAAKNEGEMAGVMAHEIAHVALRHGTAGATRQSGIGNQLGVIGLILGGAILGGQAGAQAGQIAAAAWQTKYSREYETQADILGAQIMARAGYDPVDLANMFQTIAAQSGGNRAPQWLSSHPNPGNRYQRINQEASLLRVSGEPIKNTRDFRDAQARLRGQPRAQSTAEIERGGQQYPSGGGTSSGSYSRTTSYPSNRYRTYTAGNFLSVSVPDNWREFGSGSDVTFAPEGAYGNEGITQGAMIGVTQASSRNLRQATQSYVSSLLQGNNYLRQQSGYSSTNLDGRSALVTQLAGRSPITGQTEIVTVYTTQMRDGNLLYVATVAPSGAASRYNGAFSNMLRSLQIND